MQKAFRYSLYGVAVLVVLNVLAKSVQLFKRIMQCWLIDDNGYFHCFWQHTLGSLGA